MEEQDHPRSHSPVTEPEVDFDFAALVRLSRPLVAVLDLAFIRTRKVEAEVLDRSVAADLIGPSPTARTAEIQIGTQEPNYLVFKLVQEEVFVDSEGNEGARVLVELESGWSYPEGFEPVDEQVTAAAQTLAPRVVFPFYRETVASMLTRLDVTSLMPGLMKFPPDDGE